jgi:DNA-binding transcriptional LysR family regulator
MDLNKVKYFQAVASTLNISKACKLVHLSQPALSLQIQSFEHDLGFKLFERNNRGLILTEEGHKLFERAQLLVEWETETQDLINEQNSPKGKVSLGTYTTASSYLITPKLKPFFTQYNDISIAYDYSDTDSIIAKIKNLELDCAIISEVPDDAGIEKTPFFNNQLILVAHKDRKISKTITPSQLTEIDFLSYPLKLDYCYVEVERKLGKYLKRANHIIESTSFDTLKQSLLSDLGITFMPEYLVTNELQSKILKQINIKGINLPIQFSFITKKDRTLPKRVQVLKEHFLK